MTEKQVVETNVEDLLLRLRQAKFSAEERRSTLDLLQNDFIHVLTSALRSPQQSERGPSDQLLNAISQGPNDARRIAFQCLSQVLDAYSTSSTDTRTLLNDNFLQLCFQATCSYLRSTLKLQKDGSSSSNHAAYLYGVGATTLSLSSLRAVASGLKALHGLLQCSRKLMLHSNQVRSSNAASSLDIVISCLTVGLEAFLPSQGAAQPPFSRSSIRFSALNLGDTQGGARPELNHLAPSTALSKSPEKGSFGSPSVKEAMGGSRSGSQSRDPQSHVAHAMTSDSDNDTRSESEQSDISIVSSRSTSSKIALPTLCKDDVRKFDSARRSIRQNSLFCLLEVNIQSPKSMYMHFGNLLPEDPPSAEQRGSMPSSVSIPNRLQSQERMPAFSLFTIISRDRHLAVRLAAVQALQSILAVGARQFGLAQQSPGRTWTFTSLSSRLATWVVNSRSHLVCLLQRAIVSNVVSIQSSTSDSIQGFPSSLTIALLQLSATFVTSTAKSRLTHGNSEILLPIISKFCSQSDPAIKAAAEAAITALTKSKGSKERQSSSISNASFAQCVPTLSAPADHVELLPIACSEGEQLPIGREDAEHLVNRFNMSIDPREQLRIWEELVKFASSGPAGGDSVTISNTLLSGWQRLTGPVLPPELRSTLIGHLPELCKTLEKDCAQSTRLMSSLLKDIEVLSQDQDEVVRAAAVRIVGILVLPQDWSESSESGSSAVHSCVDFRRLLLDRRTIIRDLLLGRGSRTPGGLLKDESGLVRQRAMWCLANSLEAVLRGEASLATAEEEGLTWNSCAQVGLAAALDIEGVAVSAYRSFGSLLALIERTGDSVQQAVTSMLSVLCKVLETSSKPPKSRWNAACALERAFTTDSLVQWLAGSSDQSSHAEAALLDRIVAVLCNNLSARMYKVRMSVGQALLTLGLGRASPSKGNNQARMIVVGDRRRRRILDAVTRARSSVDGQTSASQLKEANRYNEELGSLLQRIQTCYTCTDS